MAFLKDVLLLVLACGCTLAEYTLTHLDTVYFPKSYNPAVFEYNVGAAEQIAVDQNQPYIYVSGLNFIRVVDISNPSDLNEPYYATIGGPDDGEGTDVETCGNLVAVSYDNFLHPLNGSVLVYTTYNSEAEVPMELLYEFAVGSMPDMLKFSSDCSRLVVAVEGELRMVEGSPVDPEGLVAIITFPAEGQDPALVIADFNRFNDREDEYVARGVRRVYNGEGTGQSTTFAQDLEPEYVAINDDNTQAYVVLQENNAVAVVDINAGVVVELYSFGSQIFNPLTLDASDRDGGINMQPWDIRGMPQPDGVAYIRLDGTAYLATANEGDIKEYEESDGFPFDWNESQRGNDFEEDDFASSVSSDFIDQVANNEELGRLDMSVIDGKDAEGKFTKLYSYGSRGFSFYTVTDFTRVYDSGDELETLVKDNFPTIFNTNPNSESDTPEEAMDTRSDNRGSEPEAVEYGESASGDKLVFLGLERPGFVCVYLLSTGENGLPALTFQSINYGGGFGASWEDLYEQRAVRDLDAEDLRFIPASRDLPGGDLLAVVGTYSGTLSLYQVSNDAVNETPKELPDEPIINVFSSSPLLLPVHVLVMFSSLVAKILFL